VIRGLKELIVRSNKSGIMLNVGNLNFKDFGVSLENGVFFVIERYQLWKQNMLRFLLASQIVVEEERVEIEQEKVHLQKHFLQLISLNEYFTIISKVSQLRRKEGVSKELAFRYF